MKPGPALFAALMVSIAPATPVQAESAAEYEARIKAVDDQIQQLANEVESVRSERRELIRKMSSTEDLIKDRVRRINVLQNDITQYEQKLTELEKRLLESENRVATNKAMLGNMIRDAMQVGQNTGIQVMFQHSNPVLASRLGVYYDYYFRASGEQILSATQQLDSVRLAHQEALKSRNWLQYLKKKASGQKQSYTGSVKASVKSISQVDAELTTKQQSVESLRQDQQRLTELLKQLKENKLGASGFFAAGKGKYPWPVSGRQTARFGELKSVGKLTWTGMYIEADEGDTVRVIADGEVVYADWLQGFGKLVIVDHGDGYMTLYGGNRELQVVRDTWVETGSSIATVGDSRGHKQPGVYFEIRHNAKPVKPESWVDAKNSFKTADVR